MQPRIYVVTVHGATGLWRATSASQALRAALIGGHDVHSATQEEIYDLARMGVQVMDAKIVLDAAKAGFPDEDDEDDTEREAA